MHRFVVEACECARAKEEFGEGRYHKVGAQTLPPGGWGAGKKKKRAGLD